MNSADNLLVGQARLAQFVERLKELGWTNGRNVHLDIRWGADDVQRYCTPWCMPLHSCRHRWLNKMV